MSAFKVQYFALNNYLNKYLYIYLGLQLIYMSLFYK